MITRGGVHRHVGAAILAVAFVATSCSGSSSAEDALPPTVSLDSTTSTARPTTSSSSSTTSSTTTSSTLPGERPLLEIPTEWDSDLDEIFGRYLLYWDAFLIAMGPPQPDPDYPPLVRLTDPDLHEEISAQIRESAEKGQIVYNPEDSQTDHGLRLPNPIVLSKTEGNKVVIQDCFINGWVMEDQNGRTLDDSVSAKLYNVDMKVIDSEWRVLAVVEAGPDSSGYQECQEYLD